MMPIKKRRARAYYRALGKKNRGVSKQFSPEQLAAAGERLALARAKRWLTVKQRKAA